MNLKYSVIGFLLLPLYFSFSLDTFLETTAVKKEIFNSEEIQPNSPPS